MSGFNGKGFSFSKQRPSSSDTPKFCFGKQGSSGPLPAKKERHEEDPVHTTIIHDIADGTTISALESHDEGSVLTLRLTNNSGLTLMPAICSLPNCVQHVLLDESCASITKFDSSPVAQREDRRGFLRHSTGVLQLDCSMLTKVKDFGNYFLSGCSNIESVTFPSLSQASGGVSVGISFLHTCKVKSIDLTYFSQLESVSDGFLQKNSLLEELVLPPLPRLHTIGKNFLRDCAALKSVTFTAPSKPLFTFSSMGEACFRNCGKLEALDLTPLFTHENQKAAAPVTIGETFCIRCESLRSLKLPPSVSLVVGEAFLHSCASLETIDLSFFLENGMTHLPGCFLYKCSSLTELDLSPLNALTTVGPAAFAVCRKLVKLDFSSWVGLSAVGNEFLFECQALQTVSLPLHGFQIGQSFLSFTAVKSVDLRCCSPMTTVPDSFLTSCKGLEEMDLAPLSHVTAIGDGFLAATKLKAVHLPFTAALTSIGAHFLHDNETLESVTVSKELHDTQSVTTLGDNFMSDSIALTTLDMTFLGNVQQIEAYFMYNCRSLKTLDTTSLTHVTSVDEYFLAHCASLEEIDLGLFRNCNVVPARTLSDCKALKRVHNEAALSNVISFASHFLCDCVALESLDLSSLALVEHFGECSVAGCQTLETFDISGCTRLRCIDEEFLGSCTSLKTIRFPNKVPKGLAIGDDFLADCTSLTAVDLRFLDKATVDGTILDDCTPETLTAIIVPTSNKSGKFSKPRTHPVVGHLSQGLQRNIVECPIDGEPLSQLQWSWEHHARHSKSVQKAVMCVFGGIQYQHNVGSVDSESRSLPSEVAYEICRFMGTPTTDLLGGEKKKPKFTNFGTTRGFAFKKK